jgi:hypothetical protein
MMNICVGSVPFTRGQYFASTPLVAGAERGEHQAGDRTASVPWGRR